MNNTNLCNICWQQEVPLQNDVSKSIWTINFRRSQIVHDGIREEFNLAGSNRVCDKCWHEMLSFYTNFCAAKKMASQSNGDMIKA